MQRMIMPTRQIYRRYHGAGDDALPRVETVVGTLLWL